MAKRKTARKSARRIVTRTVTRVRQSPTARLIGKAIISGSYGAIRSPVSNFVKSKVGGQFGNLGDDFAMLILTGAGATYGKGTLRKVAESGFIVESALFGSQLTSGMLVGTKVSNNGGRR